jgi:hypothetical protein
MMQALLCCSPVAKARPGNVLCCCQALDPDMLLSCCQVKVSCCEANDRVFCFGVAEVETRVISPFCCQAQYGLCYCLVDKLKARAGYADLLLPS